MWLISLLSVVVISGGFAVLHFSLARPTAELRVAGWVLVIGGVLNIAGMFYFPPQPPAPVSYGMSSYRGAYDMDAMPVHKQCHKKITETPKPEKPKD